MRMESTQQFNPPSPLRFRQSERLRLRTLVDRVFSEGQRLYEWPLRAMVLPMQAEELEGMFKGHIPPSTGQLQLMVTVPKKKRRRAVDRVRMRRRIRESWRLHRLPLLKKITAEESIRTLSVGIVFVADKNVDYSKIEKSMQKLLVKIDKIAFPSSL